LAIIGARNLKKREAQELGLRIKKVTDEEAHEMIIPVRCFTCGGLVGDKWEEFVQRVKAGEKTSEILNSLGVNRYCCRRMLLSHVEIIDEILRFFEEAEKQKEVRNYY
jgi:DNA-directed RNA polymerase subunit N